MGLRENIALIGPAGVGKSHICQSLGHRACMAGYTTLYVSANQMFMQLRAARADNSLEKKLLRFTTPKQLIIDDMGLRPLRDDEPLDLYEIFRQRYETGTSAATSAS